eukprot:3032024-Amphidinium_carterae.1
MGAACGNDTILVHARCLLPLGIQPQWLQLSEKTQSLCMQGACARSKNVPKTKKCLGYRRVPFPPVVVLTVGSPGLSSV